MRERVLLRDHAAHRDAEEMEPVEAEAVDEAGDVLGELIGRVGPRRRRGLADAAVVVDEHAVALTERGKLQVPRLLRVGEAVDEDERLLALSVQLVGEVDPVHRQRRHGRDRTGVGVSWTA